MLDCLLAAQLNEESVRQTAHILGLRNLRLDAQHGWQACDAYLNQLTITPALVRHVLQLKEREPNKSPAEA